MQLGGSEAMSGNAEGLSAGENAEHMLLRLDELDELMRSGSDMEQHTISRYLRDETDLHGILAQHEAELSLLREDFIHAYVDEAESICSLYTEFVECEKNLVQFEEEIITFQRQLADSAEDMVKMQQQTVSLVRSIDNRRLGSSKLKGVYTALWECEDFCNAIAHREVDKKYLEIIAEVKNKLSFFSSNEELEGSAVDLEIRPQLEIAAARAGDKLQRYLIKRIMTLSSVEDISGVESLQLSLLDDTQNTMGFLKSYNPLVAEAVFQEYTKRMSDAFSRHIRAVVRKFGEICAAHTSNIETIIVADDVHDVLSNRDSGSPEGNCVTSSPSMTGFPFQQCPRRERSVSLHMRSLAERMLKPDRPFTVQGVSIQDTIASLYAVRISGASISLDAKASQWLDGLGTWVWQFLQCMHLLIRLCVSECHFVGSFFSSSSVWKDYEEVEALARAVLLRPLDVARTGIVEDLRFVKDRQCVLAGLRIVDCFKGYLCHLQDPVPLLLLSGIIELVKTTLITTLHDVIVNDEKSTQFLATMRLTPFQMVPDDVNMGTCELLGNKSYAATLGPHPIVQRFIHIGGEVELLNCLCLSGSMVNGKDVLVYDPLVSSVFFHELEVIADFISTLSKRHKNSLAQRIFCINNLIYILVTWTRLAAVLSSVVENKEELCAAPPAHTALIESRLSNEVTQFVDEDSKVNETFGYLFDFVRAAEETLGSAFFSDSGLSVLPSVKSLPDALSETATMRAVSEFSQSWQANLSEACSHVKHVVKLTMSSAVPVEEYSMELENRILKEYTHTVVEANTKMHTVVTRLFQRNGDMHAKLTSNTTVLQEVRRVLQC